MATRANDFDAIIEIRTVHQIKNGYIFFGVAAVVFGYILYTMIRARKGERPGFRDRESEL